MLLAFKAINQVTKVDIIPIDDAGAAVKAAGVINFTGAVATEDGTIIINIGSRKNHSYALAIEDTDDATTIGDKLVAAIAADDHAIVTAINTTGSVAITAINGGTSGNFIGLEASGIVAGVTSSIVITAMTSGATDPTITTLFDVVAGKRYQTVIYPSVYDIATLTTDFLDGRWNADNIILDGVGIISKTDTLANLKTYLNLRNSQNLIVHCNKKIDETLYKGSSLFELDDVISAQFGAIRSLRLTQDANISRYVIAQGFDLRGGAHIASLPYFNTPFFNLSLIDTAKGFTTGATGEEGELNDAGGFLLGNNVSNNTIIASQVYTTYKTDVAANPDLTYQFLNSVDTLSNIAEFNFNNLRADYAQHRLTNGAVQPGYNMANADTIRSSLIEYYITLSGQGYVLTRAGQTALTFFSENLTITLDLLNGKVSSIAEVPLVVQLRKLDIILKAVFELT